MWFLDQLQYFFLLVLLRIVYRNKICGFGNMFVICKVNGKNNYKVFDIKKVKIQDFVSIIVVLFFIIILVDLKDLRELNLY